MNARLRNKTFILASSSPRRAQLLTQIGVRHEILSPAIDEERDAAESPRDYVERMAISKAKRVWEQTDGERIVLAADTAVVSDGRVFGKPRDRADAKRMLLALLGRAHDVLTGVCVRDDRGCRSCVDASRVWCARVDDDEVEDYLNTGEYADKAGGYAIQGEAARFIERIEGSYSGIVGLPLHRLRELWSE